MSAIPASPTTIIMPADTGWDERAIHHPGAGYHQSPAWDWTALPAAVGAVTSFVALRASTSRELAWALLAATYHAGAGRPVLIGAVLGGRPHSAPAAG